MSCLQFRYSSSQCYLLFHYFQLFRLFAFHIPYMVISNFNHDFNFGFSLFDFEVKTHDQCLFLVTF